MRILATWGATLILGLGCGSGGDDATSGSGGADSGGTASGSGASPGTGGTKSTGGISGKGGAVSGGAVGSGGRAGSGTGGADDAGAAGAPSGGASSGGESSGGAASGGESTGGDGGDDGGGGASGSGRWIWQSGTPTPASLNAVWAVSPSDVWIAGDGGVLAHFDGDEWATVDSGTSNHLNGIWGSGADDVWVVAGGVGGEPNLLHFDGDGWSPVDADTTTNLHALWGSGPDDVWAVGASGVDGVITHFDGDEWTLSYESDLVAFAAISGSAASDVWAVGGSFGPSGLGTLAAVHWSEGGLWTPDPSESFPEIGAAVWSFAADDVWALGRDGALHFESAEWTATDSDLLSNLVGIWGSDTGRLTAVGPSGAIVEFDGSAWALERTDWALAASGGASLAAVSGTGDADRWAVGDRGTILHFEADATAEPDCVAVGGECLAASDCAGDLSDYACEGASETCCVVENACGAEPPCCGPTDQSVPALCNDGVPSCPPQASPCPLPP